MKKKFCILFVIIFLSTMSYINAENIKFANVKEDFNLKISENVNLLLKKGTLLPFKIIKKDNEYIHLQSIIDYSVIEFGKIFILPSEYFDEIIIDDKFINTIKNEKNILTTLTNYNGISDSISELEKFIFIHYLILNSNNKEKNSKINKIIFEYFSDSKNANYINILKASHHLQSIIYTKFPLALLSAYPDYNFYDVITKIKKIDNNAVYQINSDIEMEYYVKILKNQYYLKNTTIFYNDILFSINNIIPKLELSKLIYTLTNYNEFIDLKNHLKIYENPNEINALTFFEKSSVNKTLKEDILVNFCTKENKNKFYEIALKNKDIDIEIFNFLPYDKFAENISIIVKNIEKEVFLLSQNIENTTISSINCKTYFKELSGYEFYDDNLFIFLEEYRNILKLSLLTAKVYAFKDFGSVFNNYSLSVYTSFQNQAKINEKIDLLKLNENNLIKGELYLLTISNIFLRQLENTFYSFSEFEDTINLNILNLQGTEKSIQNSYISLSKSANLKIFEKKFIAFSILNCKYEKDFDKIHNLCIDFILKYGIDEFEKEKILFEKLIYANLKFPKNSYQKFIENIYYQVKFHNSK